MLIAVTRLRVRSVLTLLRFGWYTLAASRQAEHSTGFLGGRLLVDSHRTFWTMTAWESRKDVAAYQVSGTHRRVMPLLAAWCDEATVTHWTTEGDDLPDWPEAHRRLVADGRTSVVKNPSPSHAAREFPQPRLNPRIERTLKRKT